jgi:hypothetical protein
MLRQAGDDLGRGTFVVGNILRGPTCKSHTGFEGVDLIYSPSQHVKKKEKKEERSWMD